MMLPYLRMITKAWGVAITVNVAFLLIRISIVLYKCASEQI